MSKEIDNARDLFEAWHCEQYRTKHMTGAPTRDMHNGVLDENYCSKKSQALWDRWQKTGGDVDKVEILKDEIERIVEIGPVKRYARSGNMATATAELLNNCHDMKVYVAASDYDYLVDKSLFLALQNISRVSQVADYQFRYRKIYPIGEWSKWESINEASYKSLVANLEFYGLQHEARKLYTEPPELDELQAATEQAPLTITLADHKAGQAAYLEHIKELQATIAQQAQMIEHLRGGLTTPTHIDVANADADGYRNGFAAAIKSLPEQQYFTNWAAYTEWRATQIEAVGDFGGEVRP